MEKEEPTLNSNLTIKIPLKEEGDKLELVDNLEITESYKKTYLIPYLSTLWDSLSSRTWKPEQGLHRFAFTEVFFSTDIKSNNKIVCWVARNYWRLFIFSFKFQ